MMGEVECAGVSSSKWGRKVEVKRWGLTEGLIKREGVFICFVFLVVGWLGMGQGLNKVGWGVSVWVCVCWVVKIKGSVCL